MAAGRRKESRLHACIQAMLVWNDEFDADTFVANGTIETAKKQVMNPQLRAKADQFIDEYMRTGRIVIEDGESQ